MLKFARFEIISAVLVPTTMTRTASLAIQAHRAVFNYEPRPGFLYVRSRAISSRCNDNFDEFPAEEIKAAYRTFIGKPVFVNHNNDNHRRARGVIIDAALHEDRNADGSPDTWAEVLMEVDAKNFPVLAKAILAGEVDRTSMGTDVAYSICSACGNKATSPAEYCAHIPRMKGKRIYQVTGSTGQKEGVLVREKCFGLKFFENSLLVEDPADPTAYFLGVDDRGLKMNASLAVTANQKCKYCDAEATKEVLHSEGMAYIPACAAHVEQAKDDAARTTPDGHVDPSNIDAVRPITASRRTAGEIPVSEGDRLFYQHMHEQGLRAKEMTDHLSTAVTDLSDPAALKAHMFGAHGWDESDLWRNSHPQDHPLMSPGTDDDRPLRHDEVRGAHEHEHEVEFPDDYPSTTLGNSHFHHTGAKQAEAGRGDKIRTPEERIKRREEGQRWNRQNPVRIKHVVDHWHQATPDEKANGMAWYSDAHHLAKHVANDTGVPMHTMAGLLTTYSPQTHWATNIQTAARVARTKQPLGGPGDGVMASTHQKHAAHRLLTGEHYEDTFKGSAPKTRAFGHLIEHGGNKDPNDPRVCIDRHALSVAAGARAPDVAYEHSGLGGKKRYDQVAQTYHKAAKAISKHEGHTVEAHQVQATTWLVRQRLNEEHDRELSATAGSRSATIAQGAIKKWQSYAAEHHPSLLGKEPGTGYSMSAPDDVQHATHMAHEEQTLTKASGFTPTEDDMLDFIPKVAFGETKAPADVDTLRDEECSVCGERDSYDGNSCQQCGFVAPPQMFQDPDLGAAKRLDLRKDIAQDAGTLPDAVTGGEMTPGEQDANGGMPEEVPGTEIPGSDQVPVDPSMVDANGEVTPQTDPAQIAQQQMEMLQSGQPITPDMIGPNGEIAVDPNAAVQHFDQGGEPFTPGPNAPGEPEGPEDPLSPDALNEQGEEIADGQEEVIPAREGDPGTPADGVADLQCPACGFQSDAEQPQSTNMDEQAIPAPGAGTMAGDVCPQCQGAQLLSVGEMEQMAGAPPRVG